MSIPPPSSSRKKEESSSSSDSGHRCRRPKSVRFDEDAIEVVEFVSVEGDQTDDTVERSSEDNYKVTTERGRTAAASYCFAPYSARLLTTTPTMNASITYPRRHRHHISGGVKAKRCRMDESEGECDLPPKQPLRSSRPGEDAPPTRPLRRLSGDAFTIPQAQSPLRRLNCSNGQKMSPTVPLALVPGLPFHHRPTGNHEAYEETTTMNIIREAISIIDGEF